MPRGRPHASWLRQVEFYLKDTCMTGLASAWAMDRRSPIWRIRAWRAWRLPGWWPDGGRRSKVDAVTRCSGVRPNTRSDLEYMRWMMDILSNCITKVLAGISLCDDVRTLCFIAYLNRFFETLKREKISIYVVDLVRTTESWCKAFHTRTLFCIF